MKCLVLLLAVGTIAIANVRAAPAECIKSLDEERQCGYEGCPVPMDGMTNVHIVAHTHDDVGWLKTIDQYYYGSKTTIQRAGVQYILDSVVKALLRNPERRFIYVESEFFFKWWVNQSPDVQQQVRTLINEGRLEFIGGAWSMNDEATTHYQSLIDQTTWGLRMLNDTFGECARPRIGWQIDPFGHSNEQASIFARMGYDGMFVGRLDHEDKAERLSKKTTEFIWKSSENLGENADLFTSVLFNDYRSPPELCFDVLCSDDPIIDGEGIPDNNVDYKVDKLFEYVAEMIKGYSTNNVLITMGEDFHFSDANMWFKNLDKLIKYSNERQASGSNINVFYSTPGCYLKAVHDANLAWPSKTDDFFPYSSDPHAFWTGYFTSRPTKKRFERMGNQFLQICKQLTTNALTVEADMEAKLTYHREQMGIMQHHDANTGTEKQHVANDYAYRLMAGFDSCQSNTKTVLNQYTSKDFETPVTFEFGNCLELNISSCAVSENSETFMVTLYNPLGYATFQHVRVPVPDINYIINDHTGGEVDVQFVEIAEPVLNLAYRESPSRYDMVFLASDIPAMGYKSYYLSKGVAIPSMVEKIVPVAVVPLADTVVGNSQLSLTFSETTNLLKSIEVDGEVIPIVQNFFYYEGMEGNNAEIRNRSSGAYMFRPNSDCLILSETATLEVFNGELVDEVHQVFNSWVSQVIRIYKDDLHIEFEWMVGPIPVDDSIGKEIVTKYMTQFNTDGIFYTDSNGRDMVQRKRDHRFSYTANIQEPIAGNYYPITTRVALDDGTHRLAILTDRAEGGSSMNDGELEIMVHRRLLHDDAKGVGEALNEIAYEDGLVTRGTHYLFIGKSAGSSPTLKAKERFMQAKKLLAPWPFFSDLSGMSLTDWQNLYTHTHSGISTSLPPNIHLMTFETWKDNAILLRLEHILEIDEDPVYSAPITVNLKEVFANVNFESFKETNLAANQWIEDMASTRLKFRSADTGYVSNNHNFYEFLSQKWNVLTNKVSKTIAKSSGGIQTMAPEDFDVTLNPMEIRTFVLFKQTL